MKFKRSKYPKAKFLKGNQAKDGGEEKSKYDSHKKAYRPSRNKDDQGKQEEQGDRRSKRKFKLHWKTS